MTNIHLSAAAGRLLAAVAAWFRTPRDRGGIYQLMVRLDRGD